MLLIFVIYYGIRVPINISFAVEQSTGALIFDAIGQALFIFDILFNFFTAVKPTGVIVWGISRNTTFGAGFHRKSLVSIPFDSYTIRMRIGSLGFPIIQASPLWPILKFEIALFNPNAIAVVKMFAGLLMVWHWMAALLHIAFYEYCNSGETGFTIQL